MSEKQTLGAKNWNYFLTHQFEHVCLIETVLLSTHNICFDWQIRKLEAWNIQMLSHQTGWNILVKKGFYSIESFWKQ